MGLPLPEWPAVLDEDSRERWRGRADRDGPSDVGYYSLGY
jgi:hypothetical protein